MRHLLSGVASLVLASALAASPSFAQLLPRGSTPAERAETQDLNDQAATDAETQTTADNAVAASDQSDYQAAQQQYDQAQSNYQSQLNSYDQKNDAYQQQRQDYQAQKQDFHAQADTYDSDANRYEDQLSEADDHFGDRILIAPGDRGPLVPLDRVAEPGQRVDGAPLEDRAGHIVGHFDHMARLDDGRPGAVVTLSNDKHIAVDDAHLRFKPRDSVVIADLSFDELDHMPRF